MGYAFPKTIDGELLAWQPRTPFEAIRDRSARRKFASELASSSTRTHRKLEKAMPEMSNFQTASRLRQFSLPTAPRAMRQHAFAYFPPFVEDVFHRCRFDVHVLRTSSMIIKSRQELRDWNQSKKKSDWLALNTNGLFIPDERRILLRSDTKPYRTKSGDIEWQHVEDVFGHELGHLIDWYYGWFSTEDQSLLECFHAERFLLDEYSASTPSEFFATGAWLNARYPDEMAFYMPQTFDWFEELFWQCSSTYDMVDQT